MQNKEHIKICYANVRSHFLVVMYRMMNKMSKN